MCPAARAPVTRAVAVDSVKVPKGIGVEAMTGFGDRLYLAWVGHRDQHRPQLANLPLRDLAARQRGHINILTDPGSPHDPPARLDEARSLGGPVLCSHEGSLSFTRYGENGGRYLSRLDWA